LLYGSEKWIVKARDVRRMTEIEMKYVRITARYTWTDHKTNTGLQKKVDATCKSNAT
jgi:hypothetical protein